MPDGGLTEFLSFMESASAAESGIEIAGIAVSWQTMATVATAAYLQDQQRKAQNAAKDAYNASLKDRYVMVRGRMEQRQLVLGRQRVSGPISFIRSYGTYNASLVFAVVLAAHEIDAVETVYFDDDVLTLDGSGNVIGVTRFDDFSIAAATATVTIGATPKSGSVTATAYYGSTVTALTVTGVTGTSVSVSGANPSATGLLRVTYTPDPCPFVPQAVVDNVEVFTPGSSSQTFTISKTPISGTVRAVQTTGTGPVVDNFDIPITVSSVTGTSVSLSGMTVGLTVTVSYQDTSSVSRARIRKYLGAAGQTADATMVSNLPGLWTSNHKGSGLAYLVVELDYDPDSFPGGIPNVSAIVRGMKCYDPRTTTTAWTENPALLMRAYATHSLGGRIASTAIDDTRISAAANICDTSTGYVIGANTNTRALYTAGYVAKTGMRPADVLNELCAAMGGKWWFADGVLKVKAGSYTAPVTAVDDSWLSDSAAIQIQPRRNRQDVINAITGTFCDQDREYKALPFPKFSIASYITDDGAELPLDVTMSAVSFSAQAQYLAAAQIRRQRNGLVLKAIFNLKAYTLEPGDNVTVTLARFGWSSKVFEVMDVGWSLDGGIDLTLQESDPSIWNLDSTYTTTQISSGTTLPSPWVVQTVTGVACASGTSELMLQNDGTVISTIKVTWSGLTDAYAMQSGGGVEVKFGLAVDPETAWRSVIVAPGVTQARLTPVEDGRIYIVKARAFSLLAKGQWSMSVAHQVVGKSEPPSDVTGLAGTVSKGRIVWSWDVCPDVDYSVTEARLGGSTWATAGLPPAFKGTANTYTQVVTAAGTYTLRVRHEDTSGNLSTNTTSATVTVAAADLVQSAITCLLTNESAVVAAATDGTVASFSGTGGTFKVFDGADDKTGTGSVTYSVQSASGVTVTIADTGVYTVSAMSADTGTATLRAVYSGVTLDKAYSIAKSKTGATGTRGSLTTARAIAGTAWSDTEAAAAIAAAGGGTPLQGDIVTLYNATASYSETRVRNGSSAWDLQTGFLGGSALVDGGIAQSKLANALSSRIDLIDGASGVAGTVNTRIDTAAAAASAATSAVGSALQVEIRARSQQVQANAEALLRSVLSTDKERTGRVSDVATATQILTTNFNAGISAEATARLALATRVSNNEAAILSEATARSTADASEASARQLLATQVTGGYSGTDVTQVTSGLIYSERVARSTADTSLAQQISLLSAGSGDQFDFSAIYYFDSGVEGWGGNGTPTASNGFLRPANQASGAYVTSPSGLAINAITYGQFRARIQKVGSPTFAGYLWWKSASDTDFDASRRVSLTSPVFDASGFGLITSNPSWTGTIDQIRLDLSSAQTATDYFQIDWSAIGRGSPGASIAQLYTEQTARASADSALSTSISALSATVSTNNTNTTAAINAEATTRAAADTAQVTDRKALASVLTGLDDPTGKTLADLSSGIIYEEKTARSTADTAMASSISTLNTSVGSLSGQVTSLSSSVTTLQSSTAQQSVTLLATSKTADLAAQKVAQTDLTNTLTADRENRARAATQATVSSELYANIQAGLSAEATARLALAARVGDNAAAILSEATTRATADQALASSITTVQSSVAGNTVAIQQEASTRASQTAGLYAQWTVKIDANNYVSGFGLASEPAEAGGSTSLFAIRADKFLVASPSGPGISPSAPFSVVTTGSNAGIYLANAYIQNGAITNAKIGNTIASQSFDGTIDDTTGAFTNYGTAGWALSKAGGLVVDAAVVRHLTLSQGRQSAEVHPSPGTPTSAISGAVGFLTGYVSNGFSARASMYGYMDLYVNTASAVLVSVGYRISATDGSQVVASEWVYDDRRLENGRLHAPLDSTYRYRVPLSFTHLFGGNYYRSRTRLPGTSGLPLMPDLVVNKLTSGTWSLSIEYTVDLFQVGSNTNTSCLTYCRMNAVGIAEEMRGSLPHDAPSSMFT